MSAERLCSTCGYANGPSRNSCKNCRQPLNGVVAAAAPHEYDTLRVQVQHQAYFDKREQYDKIASELLPGEVILAVFDMKGGGTGFLGVTTKRLVIYDKAFLRKMKAVVSIPIDRLTSVAAQDESGLFTGRGFWSSSTLVVTTSHGQHEFEFRGADKAHHAHQLILGLMVGIG